MRGDQAKSLVRRSENFLRRAREIHGDKFDYSRTVFIRAKSPVLIGCPVHGEQIMIPDKHLTNKYGCAPCWEDYRRSGALVGRRPAAPRPPMPRPRQLRLPANTVSQGKFLSTIEEKIPLGITIKIERYFSLHEGEVIIICSEHGESKRKALALWHPKIKYFCIACKHSNQAKAKIKTFESFRTAAESIHGDRYHYYEEDYVNRGTKIRIECTQHGVFIKTPQKVLSGQGCPECTKDRLRSDRKLLGGYNELFFENNPDKADEDAHVYYLKIGKVYKIGITATDPRRRFSSLKNVSNNEIEVLQLVKTTLLNAYNIEQEILQEFSAHRVHYRWSTELFDVDVLAENELEMRVAELEKQVL